MNDLAYEPMSVGEILDRSFILYRRHFARFLAIVAIIHVPMGLIGLLALAQLVGNLMRVTASGDLEMSPDHADPGAVFAFSGATMAASSLVTAIQGLCQAALVHSVSEAYLGREASVRAAYRFVLPRTGWVILAALISSLAYGFGLCFCLVPGLFVYILFSLVMPVLVIEGLNAFESIGRSARFVTGNFGKATSVAGAAGLIYWVIVLFFSGLARLGAYLVHETSGLAAMVVNQIVTMLGPLLATPVVAVPTILFYYDLRIRREGFDLETSLDTLERERGGAPAGLRPA